MQETGLLEQAVLYLEPPDAAGERRLRAASGQTVGLARPTRLRPWWWFWSPVGLAVHEYDDEPLVFTMRRGLILFPFRDVRDSEGELVGSLAAGWLLDRWKQPVAEFRWLPEGKGVFLSASGDELAAWVPEGAALRLEIREQVRGEPFLKMLILAGVLHMATADRKW